MNERVFIVFDGTSHYVVYECDIDAEIKENDVEIIEGPYNDWNDEVEDMVTKLNDEAYGTHMYR